MRYVESTEEDFGSDTFDQITEEEIIGLWRSFKGGGLEPEEAWHAVVTGMALDLAFERSRAAKRINH